MAYPYPLAFPDTRQLHGSSYSALSGALEPALVQSGYRDPARPNATGYADVGDTLGDFDSSLTFT
jgi:hypothetical protein